MLNISQKQKRSNASILCELDIEKATVRKIISLKLGYFVHILRGSGSPLTLGIKRRQGRRENKAWQTKEEL